MKLIATIALALAGCSTAADEAEAECQDSRHCPSGDVCQAGRCVPPGCGDGGACRAGTVCQRGECVSTAVQCVTDVDCANGRCVDGECFANQCQDGVERVCNTDCGEGVERCRGGVWNTCTAQPVMEVCGDQQDNDCDGQTDEQCGGCADSSQRPCTTECGEGSERCVQGMWQGCDAPRVRQEICGSGVDEDCDGTIDEGCDGCADGATRACQTECGGGMERCSGATWRECSAQRPQDELCDGADNDCDGATDENLLRDCGNACGGGTETCQAGAWAACTAPENCACDAEQPDTQVCGACGFRTRTCAGAQFGAWSACDEGMAECQPGADEGTSCGMCGSDRRVCTAECRWGTWQGCKDEGVCVPDTREDEACEGGCGTRSRQCSATCEWADFGSCVGGPAGDEGCAPGEMDQRACGNCGTQQRACGQACAWGEWQPCQSEGACRPGDTDGRACGLCGAETRTCDAACAWGDYGACDDGGQCQDGEEETRACGQCGEQRRVCEGCVWSAWGGCGSEGPCTPGDTENQRCGESDRGLCEFGVAVRTCGPQCEWSAVGQCLGAVNPVDEVCGDGVDQDCDGNDIRRPDQWEPNDACRDCSLLADGEVDVNVFLRGTHDYVGDTHDYYCFNGDDSSFDPTESVDLMLSNIPNGANYNLYLYRNVADCNAGRPLASSSEPGSRDEVISWGEVFNGDDNGRYVVEVRRISGHSCSGEYRLDVSGLR